jgi:hypothetical protein
LIRDRLGRAITTDSVPIVLAIAALALAITSNSLWIDEAFTAWIVAHSSWHSFWSAVASPLFPPVDRQYPLYILWMWGWTHLFGFSEYALRAANIPFGAVFVIALALSSRLIFGRRFAWLPFALAPFAWFYMNEARQYMMLLAFSTATIGALGVAIYGPREVQARATWLFYWSLLATCMTDVLAILAFPGILALSIGGVRKGLLDMRPFIGRGLRLAPLFALAIGYYALTSSLPGASGAILEDSRRGPSLAFSLVSLYEQVGLAGIGPPRNTARLKPAMNALLPYLALLVPAISVYVIALGLSLRRRPSSRAIAFFGAWAASFVFAAAMSAILDVRFLGRHMSAMVPFMLLGSVGLFRARPALVALAAVLLVSDLRISFVPEYGKDDYRAAVNDVIGRVNRAGGEIDWVADSKAANYYGLALRSTPDPAGDANVGWPVRATGTPAQEWSVDAAQAIVDRQLLSGPVYIVMSRPDAYDEHHALDRILQRPAAKLVGRHQGFEIYELNRADIGRTRPHAETLRP